MCRGWLNDDDDDDEEATEEAYFLNNACAGIKYLNHEYFLADLLAEMRLISESKL